MAAGAGVIGALQQPTPADFAPYWVWLAMASLVEIQISVEELQKMLGASLAASKGVELDDNLKAGAVKLGEDPADKLLEAISHLLQRAQETGVPTPKAELLASLEKFEFDRTKAEKYLNGVGTLMTRSITERDLEVVAARHFHVLDTDGNGSLDILEFVAGMGTLFKGSVEQQWKYAFDLFDVDKDGFVTHKDLSEMFLATAQVQQKMLVELLKFTRDQLQTEGHDDVAGQFQIDIDMMDQSEQSGDPSRSGSPQSAQAIEELVSDIFAEVDLDGDRRISFAEFCESEILRSEVERLARHSVSFFSQAQK